jgi:hypothetical protein
MKATGDYIAGIAPPSVPVTRAVSFMSANLRMASGVQENINLAGHAQDRSGLPSRQATDKLKLQ